MEGIPPKLLQGLCYEAKARFTDETGLTGKVTVELRIPDAPPPRFTVTALVTDKISRLRREYEIEVEAQPIH
jgi:hypothetical protein